MPPTPTPPPTPSVAQVQGAAANPQKSKHYRLKAISLLVVVAIGIAAALYFFIFKNTNPNQYKYHKLDSYSLTKGLSGSGIVFEKPVEFKVTYQTTTAVALNHNLAKNKLAAYISAAVTPLKAPLFTSDLQNYNKVLADPSSKFYSQTTAGTRTFTQNNFSHGSTVKFANAKKFTNPNIKSNGWEFDFTATDPVEKTQNTGEAVFAIAPKGYYYFLVYATNDNWQPNQKVWSQIFNSLKIDQ